MTFFQELTSNQTLMTGVTGWVVAQVLKTILDIGLNHSFNPERLVGSGADLRLRRNAEFPFSDGLCAYDGIRNEVRSGKL